MAAFGFDTGGRGRWRRSEGRIRRRRDARRRPSSLSMTRMTSNSVSERVFQCTMKLTLVSQKAARLQCAAASLSSAAERGPASQTTLPTQAEKDARHRELRGTREKHTQSASRGLHARERTNGVHTRASCLVATAVRCSQLLSRRRKNPHMHARAHDSCFAVQASVFVLMLCCHR